MVGQATGMVGGAEAEAQTWDLKQDAKSAQGTA